MICIYETEQRMEDAAMPLFSTTNTAAMAPINWMADPAVLRPAHLEQRVREAVAHLNTVPRGRGLRWLNMGGWFCDGEFGPKAWGGKVTTPDYSKTPDIGRWLALSMEALTIALDAGLGELDGVYIDAESPWKGASGVWERDGEQTFRAWFLRRVTEPWTAKFGCEVLNFGFGKPSTAVPTIGWWGGPLKSGKVTDTSSVECYSIDSGDGPKSLATKFTAIRSCLRTGKVIPHLPPLFEDGLPRHAGYQSRDQAVAQIETIITACAALGVETVICAAYMWPRDQWPILTDTINRALARADTLGRVATGEG